MNDRDLQVKTLADYGLKSDGSYGAGHLRHVPEIAIAVAETIATFSDIDMYYTMIASQLLGGEGRAAALIFGNMKNHEAKLNTLQSLINQHATADIKAKLKEIRKTEAPARRIRNDFAHCIWGISQHMPDCLLLSPASVWASPHGASIEVSQHGRKANIVKDAISDVLTGQNGSTLSNQDAKALIGAVLLMEQDAKYQRAWRVSFDGSDPSQIQVWTIHDAWKAAELANLALRDVIALSRVIYEALQATSSPPHSSISTD